MMADQVLRGRSVYDPRRGDPRAKPVGSILTEEDLLEGTGTDGSVGKPVGSILTEEDLLVGTGAGGSAGKPVGTAPAEEPVSLASTEMLPVPEEGERPVIGNIPLMHWRRKRREALDAQVDFPDLPEFLEAYREHYEGQEGERPLFGERGRLFDTSSASPTSVGFWASLSPDEAAQLDVLKQRIPGLQVSQDSKGKVMLWAPGMKTRAYWNKPGVTAQDLEDIAAQTLVTAPIMGPAALPRSAAMRALAGAGLGGASSVGLDLASQSQGSDEHPGVSPLRAGISTVTGGALAPGVASGAAAGARRVGQFIAQHQPFVPRMSAWRNPGRAADAQIGSALHVGINAEHAALSKRPEYPLMSQALRNKSVDPNSIEGKRLALRLHNEQVNPVHYSEMLDFYRSQPTPTIPAAVRTGWDEQQTSRMAIDEGGAATRALAREAAAKSPEAEAQLSGALTERLAEQFGRVEGFVQRLVRSAGNVSRTREQIVQAAARETAPRYESAFSAARKRFPTGIPVTSLRELLEAPRMKTALSGAIADAKNRIPVKRTSARALPQEGQPGYDLELLDLAQRRLRQMHEQAIAKRATATASDIGHLRTQLIETLDRLVPEYKVARGTAQQFFGETDALEAGAAFFRNGAQFESLAAQKAVQSMTRAEQDLFAEGYASALLQKLSALPNVERRGVLNRIADTPTARRQMEIALGPNRARYLETFLRHEALMDLARQQVGSAHVSSRMQQIARDWGPSAVGIGMAAAVYDGPIPAWTWLNPTTLTVAAFMIGGRLAQRRIDQRVAEQVAVRLTSNNPEVVERALKQVATTPMLDALRAIDRALMRASVGAPVATQSVVRSMQRQPASDQYMSTVPLDEDAINRSAEGGQ